MSKNSNKTILVIDDDRMTLSLLSTILKSLGCKVAIAENGPTAMEAIKQAVPNLVLLDIAMPRMDGYAVAQQLRARLGEGLPIVAITGRPERDFEVARRAGFTGWVQKPFDVPEFLNTISRYLSASSQHNGAPLPLGSASGR